MLLGYRRLWWHTDLIEIKSGLDRAACVARTRCRMCGFEWRDSGVDFWARSTVCGVFPLWCAICGEALPQWSVDSAIPAGGAEDLSWSDFGATARDRRND
jgi:hypothetical protein